jgi:hypothetical protein
MAKWNAMPITSCYNQKHFIFPSTTHVPNVQQCVLKIITDLSATAASTFTGSFYFLNPYEGCTGPPDIDLYFQYTLI